MNNSAASPHEPLLAASDSSPIQLVPMLLHYSGYAPGIGNKLIHIINIDLKIYGKKCKREN